MCSPGGKEGAWFADSCGGPGAQEPRDSWGHGAVAGRRAPGVCADSAGPLAPGSTAALDLRKAAPRREKSGQEPPTLALGSGGSILEPMLPRWRGGKKKSACQCRKTQEMRVGFLGRHDPLEEGMAAHSSILAWRIPWTEEPGGLQSMQ